MNYIRQQNPHLENLYCSVLHPPSYFIDKIEWVDSHMRGHIDEMKEVNDYVTHGVEIAHRNEWHGKYEVILRSFIDSFGLLSVQTQSLMKMVVDMEWNSNEIRRRQRELHTLPAAYQKGLIASPVMQGKTQRETEMRIQAYNHLMVSFSFSSLTKEQLSRYPNLCRLVRLLRRYYRKYMSELKPKMYLLTNGSSTDFKDVYNIYDINGCVYATEEEIAKIEGDWKPIIEHFKMRNFEDEFSLISMGNRSYFGRINFAPDDSGKTRISYCIDPIVQCISKAVAKCLDYVSRKVGNNCTKDQTRVLRNIIRKRLNVNGYIISTDMSKYSDTLQIKFILSILQIIGFPTNVLKAMEDLYTLPMWDSILRQITPRTSASYQGQYGDFSMITLVNIWIQCCIFDFFGEEYDMTEENCTSGAVGDDTIMSFVRNHPYLFEICQLMYNAVGVNINRTKTHTLFLGEGYADFVKRILTSTGLVPYIRLVCFHDNAPGRWIEEGLRYCRDNFIDTEEEVREACSLFLSSRDVDFICSLHKLNGGVLDREITMNDLKIFSWRNQRLGRKYSNRRQDDLRKWIDLIHSRGLLLQDTCLVGYYEHWEDCFSFEDIDEQDIDDIMEESIDKPPVSEEELELLVTDRMIHCYSHGYKDAQLEGLSTLLGFTYSESLEKFPNLMEFIEDYNISEVYRYLESRVIRDLDIYYELMHLKLEELEVPDIVFRAPYCYDPSLGFAHDLSLGKHAYNLLMRECSKHGWSLCEEKVWDNDKLYLVSPSGTQYRLYKLKRITSRSRDYLPFDYFYSFLLPYVKDREHAEECYSAFLETLPSLDPRV